MIPVVSCWVTINAVTSLDAPIIHLTPSKSPYSTKIGPNFLLHCFAEGHPSPSVQWFRNGEPYSTLTKRSLQEIYVPRSSSSDSAVYECVGTNNAGNKIQKFRASIDFQGKHASVFQDICILFYELRMI